MARHNLAQACPRRPVRRWTQSAMDGKRSASKRQFWLSGEERQRLLKEAQAESHRFATQRSAVGCDACDEEEGIVVMDETMQQPGGGPQRRDDGGSHQPTTPVWLPNRIECRAYRNHAGNRPGFIAAECGQAGCERACGAHSIMFRAERGAGQEGKYGRRILGHHRNTVIGGVRHAGSNHSGDKGSSR